MDDTASDKLKREAIDSWERWKKAVEAMPDGGPLPADLPVTARQIADQLSSLSRDARAAGLDVLAHLIEMAREEAEREAQKRSHDT